MKKIEDGARLKATGWRGKEKAPVLQVTGGSGNTGEPEVHLLIWDRGADNCAQGWFDLDELYAAIDEARKA